MKAKYELYKMNVLVVAATEFEIKPFIENTSPAEILITGVGIPATIFNLAKKLIEKKFDVVIQAGIAGSFNNKLEKAKVVLVDKDTFGDIGILENGTFSTLFEMGFGKENDFPFTNGWLMNDNDFFVPASLPVVSAITVNKIVDDAKAIKKLQTKFNATIESMEGAAFHYVCLQQNIKFLQLRSISNIVGERDKTKWALQEAIANLNNELKKIINILKQ